ncbi:MAG: HAMP domain-containing sensor histidine kinase [Bacteroidota bacterium]
MSGWYLAYRYHRKFHQFKHQFAGVQHQFAVQQEELRSALEAQLSQQDQLRERNRELEKFDTFKTKIFSIISHDLRSPINSVLGIMDLLEQGHLSLEESQRYARKAKVRVQVTLEMITNLLHWARNRMQDVAPKPSMFNVAQLTEQLVDIYGPIASDKGVRVENLIQTSHHGFGDLEIITVVIRNLLSNAIKYTPNGGTVSLGIMTHPECVQLCVKDTGMGIDTATRECLFQTQMNSKPGTSQEKGTGLGLMLSKEFIERNQGTIRVESEIGSGSTFCITFPKENPQGKMAEAVAV